MCKCTVDEPNPWTGCPHEEWARKLGICAECDADVPKDSLEMGICPKCVLETTCAECGKEHERCRCDHRPEIDDDDPPQDECAEPTLSASERNPGLR